MMLKIEISTPTWCWEARKPAVKSRLSPGRKNPISRPHSAKMIAVISTRPPARIIVCGSRKDTVGSYGLTGGGQWSIKWSHGQDFGRDFGRRYNVPRQVA